MRKFKMPLPWKEDWLPEIRERFKSMAALESGWNGHSSEPPNETALASGLTLLTFLAVLKDMDPLRISPQVVPDSSGGICIEWHEQGYDLELEIAADGGLDGWVRFPDGRTCEF